jgi:hypothetical protein
MPAYGKQLTNAEITALVEFLHALRPENRPPSVVPAPRISPQQAAQK